MKTLHTLIGAAMALAVVAGGCSKTPDQQAKAPKADTKTEQSGAAAPALWRVQDADTKIYLFGTVHILKPGLKWKSPALEKAVASADAVYLETDIEKVSDGSLMGDMVKLAANKTTCNLRCLLPDDDEDKVYAFGKDLGMSPKMLDRLNPWMIGMTFQALFMTQHGYQADQGVEKTVLKIAHENDTPLRYFETPLQQLHFFADLPMKDQTEFLIGTVESFNKDPKELDGLIKDWSEGNVEGIAKRISQTEDFGNAHVYQVLLADRNKHWDKVLEKLMREETGTYFVAVGAAHLAGPDSVIALMRRHGFEVVRE